MARTAMKKADVIDMNSPAQQALEAEITATAQELAKHTDTIMAQFGDGMPYDRTRMVNEARFYMAQSAEAMLEAGKRLIVLKENEPHGEFVEIVEAQLGMAARTAQQMMQATIKYTSPRLESKAQALAHLGKTKLFELMAADDDELAELTEGGTVAGLKLDDIDRMTSRELKAALREARNESIAKEEVASTNRRRIDALQEELVKVKRLPPDDIALRMRAEANKYADEVEDLIRVQLTDALVSIQNYSLENSLEAMDYLESRVNLLDKALEYLRAQIDMVREETSTEAPAWEGVR